MRKDIDECLLPYLHSSEAAEREQHLAYLLNEVAMPIIQRVLHRTFEHGKIQNAHGTEWQSGEDAVAEVGLKVLQALVALKDRSSERSIANFRGFVATISYRALTDQLRERYRERANHEQKIRRLLAINNDLAIWKTDANTTVCGRAAWRHEEPEGITLPSRDELHLLTDQQRPASPRNTSELILLLFDRTEEPVRFADLVSVTLNCQRRVTQLGNETESGASSVVTAVRESPVATLETKQLLKRLFAELQRLSVVQRSALLLNMSNSNGDGIECFLVAKIATEEQLAALLEISTAEFRQLLERVPITDKEIGRRLGIDSVKVSNIRKAVRSRLERRRREFFRSGTENEAGK